MVLDIIGIVLQAATALAIVIGAWQLLFHSRQMHRDFESLYVERYWQIMDRRSNDWILKGKTKPEDETIIRQYLQLCEDEIDLRELGRVSDGTWKFWADAIRMQAGVEPYVSTLRKLGTRAYPSVSRLMREPDWDPCVWSPAKRKIRGL
ncbi:MAG: hypothetical protein ABI566_07220 [Pseudolysinimonas sp.]